MNVQVITRMPAQQTANTKHQTARAAKASNQKRPRIRKQLGVADKQNQLPWQIRMPHQISIN
jgi:hypothetical protein